MIEKQITFLVADDDADDRLLLSDAFEESELDAPVHSVADGEELLRYLRRAEGYEHLKGAPLPAVILLDLNMPKKDGRAALKEIKEDPDLRLIPVVVLTTSKAEEDVVRSYGLGASSFITKPVNFEGLCDVVRVLRQYWLEMVALPPGCGVNA